MLCSLSRLSIWTSATSHTHLFMPTSELRPRRKGQSDPPLRLFGLQVVRDPGEDAVEAVARELQGDERAESEHRDDPRLLDESLTLLILRPQIGDRDEEPCM